MVLFAIAGTCFKMRNSNTVRSDGTKHMLLCFRCISNSVVRYYVTYSCAVG
jgi:hypothetical protein